MEKEKLNSSSMKIELEDIHIKAMEKRNKRELEDGIKCGKRNFERDKKVKEHLETLKALYIKLLDKNYILNILASAEAREITTAWVIEDYIKDDLYEYSRILVLKSPLKDIFSIEELKECQIGDMNKSITNNLEMMLPNNYYVTNYLYDGGTHFASTYVVEIVINPNIAFNIFRCMGCL